MTLKVPLSVRAAAMLELRRRQRPAAVRINRTIPPWAIPLRQRARYKGASGGRSSGKSHFFAEEAVECMLDDKDLRFVCIREVQATLEMSVKALVESKIVEFDVQDQFDITMSKIRRRGGNGLMIFIGMQDHTADSIKSLEGFNRAWVEEAHKLSERSLQMLLPTIRAEKEMPDGTTDKSQIWFSWNPEQRTDPVDKFFADRPPDSVHVKTTYKDNPFCPEVMKEQAAFSLATNKDAYDYIWGGGYNLGGHGRVYSNYSDKDWPEGNVDERIIDMGAELYIGQDFNVNPMVSIVGQKRVDEWEVLEAIEIPTSNTREVCMFMKDKYAGRKLIWFPDPSGNNRSTTSQKVGETDFTIIRSYNSAPEGETFAPRIRLFDFEIRSPLAAPLVVDRVNNANEMYLDLETKRRRARIHPRAQVLRTALLSFVYKPGTSIPWKGVYDHPCDANDYVMWTEFNVLKKPRRNYGTGRYAT